MKFVCICSSLSFSAAIDTKEDIASSKALRLSIFLAKDLDVQIDFLEEGESSHLKHLISFSSKAVLRPFTQRCFLIKKSSA